MPVRMGTTKLLLSTVVLVMVLAMTLAVTSPALAGTDNAKPVMGYPDYEITENGNLIWQRDVIVGKCGSTQDFAFLSKSMDKAAREACRAAGYPTSLSNTGGPPLILVPITLLILGGFLIRKSTAL
jgi:hypothetical protein